MEPPWNLGDFDTGQATNGTTTPVISPRQLYVAKVIHLASKSPAKPSAVQATRIGINFKPDGIVQIAKTRFEIPTDPEHPSLAHLNPKQRDSLVHRPDGYPRWTPRILGEWCTIGGNATFKVGRGETVADELERWIRIADADGFNLGHVIVPQAWEDIIEYLIPVLEKRGWLDDGNQYNVSGGTARENLYGTPGDSKLRASHPGSKFKFDVYPE